MVENATPKEICPRRSGPVNYRMQWRRGPLESFAPAWLHKYPPGAFDPLISAYTWRLSENFHLRFELGPSSMVINPPHYFKLVPTPTVRQRVQDSGADGAAPSFRGATFLCTACIMSAIATMLWIFPTAPLSCMCDCRQCKRARNIPIAVSLSGPRLRFQLASSLIFCAVWKATVVCTHFYF